MVSFLQKRMKYTKFSFHFDFRENEKAFNIGSQLSEVQRAEILAMLEEFPDMFNWKWKIK